MIDEDGINPHQSYDAILVLDFGSQFTHLITRRLRELNVYSEMQPCTQVISELGWKPKGIILSGGPYSVYDPAAPHVNRSVFDLGIPVLGVCYGMQELAWQHGQSVTAGDRREYGHADLRIHHTPTSPLFAGLDENLRVWMSHGDKIDRLPESFSSIAETSNAPFAAIAHQTKQIYGIQFHPEVTHTPLGLKVIENFAVHICKARQNWTMQKFRDQEIARIRQLVGDHGQVIGAVSGGVDSTVAAKLMKEAIGGRFHAVLVDNGLLRLDEAKQVEKTLRNYLGINLKVVDASKRFLDALQGRRDPEEKRKIIGAMFIDIFQNVGKEIEEAALRSGGEGRVEWLLQGTLYPDVIESISFKGPSQTIKSHHNVGGLPEKMHLKLIEPLRELFKDEVRALGTDLGIPEELVWRHPFPGPGLGIRILGSIDPDRLRMAREADHIFIEEIRTAGVYRQISQAYAAISSDKAVGVMGDQRVHGYIVMLRAVVTSDFMTADFFRFDWDVLEKIKRRIGNEVHGITRVMYDITTKPPGTIEME